MNKPVPIKFCRLVPLPEYQLQGLQLGAVLPLIPEHLRKVGQWSGTSPWHSLQLNLDSQRVPPALSSSLQPEPKLPFFASSERSLRTYLSLVERLAKPRQPLHRLLLSSLSLGILPLVQHTATFSIHMLPG